MVDFNRWRQVAGTRYVCDASPVNIHAFTARYLGPGTQYLLGLSRADDAGQRPISPFAVYAVVGTGGFLHELRPDTREAAQELLQYRSLVEAGVGLPPDMIFYLTMLCSALEEKLETCIEP